MKKIILSFIIFFSCFVGVASASATEEITNYWVRTHEGNIELTSDENNHTLTLSNMIKDYYYLFYIKDLSDNDIDYKIENATVYSPYSFTFRKWSSHLSTTLDLDTVSVFKVDETTVTFTFEIDIDFKYAILEENYNELDLTLNDYTSIDNDFLVLNAHVSDYYSNDARIVTAGVGMNYEQLSKYFYFYIPHEVDTTKSIFTFEFESENDIESIDFNLCSYSNNIYKFRLRNISSDFFDRYSEFKIVQLNTSDTIVRNINNIETVAEQKIVLDVQEDEVNFATIDKITNTIEAQYNTYYISEPSSYWGNLSPAHYRFHYLLFDIFIGNEKLDTSTILDRVSLQYYMTWQVGSASRDVIFDGDYIDAQDDYTRTSMIASLTLATFFWGDFTEEITSEQQHEYFNPQMGDSFFDWWNSFQKKGTYVVPFNTLTTVEQTPNVGLENLDHKGYTFCLFFGAEANEGSYAIQSKYLGSPPLAMHSCISLATSIEFLDVDYEVAGQKYTAVIDDTNISYDGPSDFWPGDTPYEIEGSCFFCDLFGWSFCIYCWINNTFNLIITIIVIIIVSIVFFKIRKERRQSRIDKNLKKLVKTSVVQKKGTNTTNKNKKPVAAKK